MTQPNAARIEEILIDSLYPKPLDNPAPPDRAIVVEGILHKWVFCLERLEKHRREVAEMLTHFHDNFYDKKGGGWSFLNMCMNKEGVQWGEHRDIDQLCVLAIAHKLGKWYIPREYWPILPGSMPYFTIIQDAVEEALSAETA